MVLIQLSIILIFCRFYDVFSVCQEDSWYCWRSDDKEYRHLFFVTHIISETGGGKNKLRTGSSTKYQEPFTWSADTIISFK